MRRTLLAALLTLSLPLAALAAASRDIAPAIARAVTDAARPAADRAADGSRKPAETLAFAGVRPGMIVGEFFPGGGYYTRLLSDVVGPRGRVLGLENAGWPGAVKADRALLGGGKLRNVEIDAQPFGTVRFSRPLDLAWITQNYHDLKVAEFGRVETPAFDRAVFAALKPGGVFFVLDHEAPPGTDAAAIARLHRIESAQVIREVTQAGFTLAAEGSFLRRPGDDHSLPIFDKAIQGRTDQFALRFVKPRG